MPPCQILVGNKEVNLSLYVVMPFSLSGQICKEYVYFTGQTNLSIALRENRGQPGWTGAPEANGILKAT
jgi:hypothetical protein